MASAKLFMNGRSQALRLPKEFRFEGSEVYIKKTASGVLLIPQSQSIWQTWSQQLDALQATADLFEQPREQGIQHRDELDELFD